MKPTKLWRKTQKNTPLIRSKESKLIYKYSKSRSKNSLILTQSSNHSLKISPLRRPGSIPGVGTVTAAKCIVITDEFKKFDNAKQLACHAGVVPFENSSGTSLQSRPKVSKKAHKGIKATLSNCVMSAMRYNTHFKTYYERNRTADAAQGRKK